MELNSGGTLDKFEIGELKGTVRNTAPIFPKPVIAIYVQTTASELTQFQQAEQQLVNQGAFIASEQLFLST
jgi:hypothetical protein